MTSTTKEFRSLNFKALFKELGFQLSAILQQIGLFLVACYKLAGAPHMGGVCRFQPTCSDYAVDCLKEHSFWRAVFLITKRLLRCRPFGPKGFDPAPRGNN